MTCHYPNELRSTCITLQWCHNEHDGILNNWHLNCLLNRLFRHRSKKTSKLHVTGLCEANPPVTVDSPHKGPVTWKIFPCDDVFMISVRIYISVKDKKISSCMGISFVKITWSWDCLISVTGISMLTWQHLYVEIAPGHFQYNFFKNMIISNRAAWATVLSKKTCLLLMSG